MKYKHTLGIIILVLINLFSLKSQILDQFSFSINEIHYSTIDSFTKVSINNCKFTNEIGFPQLPYLEFQYVIPFDQYVSSIDIIDTNLQSVLGNYLIYPSQPIYDLSSIPDTFINPNQTIYQSINPYIGKIAEVTDNYYDKGYHIANIRIYPLFYIPYNRALKLYTNIEIRLNLSNQNAIPDKPKFQSQWMNNIIVNDIKSNIRNFHNIEIMNGGPQEIVEINQGSNLKSILTTSNFNNLLPEYVIITNNYDINGNLIPSYNNKNMVQTFQELADWKTKKGVPTVVVTVDEIKENYQGCDVQEKIHNFLNDLYYNYTGSIFILFGGDVNIIPERYANINFHGIPEPSDLYYCGIETNWNTNNNAAFGEDGIDNVDFSSEFYYGRAPVENVIETSIFVNKIFKYEKFPIEVVNIQYVKKGIIAMWENVQCSEIESIMNSLPVSDLTLDRMLGLGKCNSMILSRINFLNALNNGQYHFVYHLDHANYLTLGTSPTLNENVNRTDFNNLSNSPYYSILFTSGCLSSEIQKDCITERFVNAPFGGGVAAIGNSTEGYSDELWMFNNFIQTLFGSGNNGFGFYNLGIVFDKCILPTGLNNFRKKKIVITWRP